MRTSKSTDYKAKESLGGGSSPRITLDWRLNIASLLNTVALIGILVTVIQAWDSILYQIKDGSRERAELTTQVQVINAQTKEELKGLHYKDEWLADQVRQAAAEASKRLYAVEGQVSIQTETLKRIEKGLDSDRNGG